MIPGRVACMAVLICLATTGCAHAFFSTEIQDPAPMQSAGTQASRIDPIQTVSVLTSAATTTPEAETIDYFEYDSEGNLYRVVDNEWENGAYVTYTTDYLDHENGVFTQASTTTGTIRQSIVATNALGAPTKVERSYEHDSRTYAYDIEYSDTGFILRMSLSVDGTLVHSIEFDASGHLSKVDNTDVTAMFNSVTQPVSLSQNEYAFVTYGYDEAGRLTELDLVGWGVPYTLSYKGNADLPSSYETCGSKTELAYAEIPASPWAAALERTPMAADVLNDVKPMDTGTTGFNLSTMRHVAITQM